MNLKYKHYPPFTLNWVFAIYYSYKSFFYQFQLKVSVVYDEEPKQKKITDIKALHKQCHKLLMYFTSFIHPLLKLPQWQFTNGVCYRNIYAWLKTVVMLNHLEKVGKPQNIENYHLISSKITEGCLHQPS